MKNSSLFKLSMVIILAFAVSVGFAQRNEIQNFKAYDQTGVNVFEVPKDDQTPFNGMKLRVGGNFTQQFQSITHSRNVDTSLAPLSEIGSGFNLATANLNLDAQLADGVSLRLTTYLSSRHHPEAWVKGGYLQVDKLTFLKSEALNKIFNDHFRLKVGHMEINYGDQHFRRTDNGNAMYNPFVGNYLMDQFTTEIGAELYYFSGPFMLMYGMTNGLIKGDVTNPDGRSPAILAKAAFDKEVSDDFRIRLAASLYNNGQAGRSTLFGGDRTGSRYYNVLDAGDFSGRFNPGFEKQMSATQFNLFLKFKGLESFTTYEMAQGRGYTDTYLSGPRQATQFATDLIFRFLEDEKVFIGGRYNIVMADEKPGFPTFTGTAPTPNAITVSRLQAGAGWFVTPNVLAKIEYVNQDYSGFNNTFNPFNEANFNGIMIEGTIGF